MFFVCLLSPGKTGILKKTLTTLTLTTLTYSDMFISRTNTFN